MDNIKVAVMRATVEGAERIILQSVVVYGRQWVRTREHIVQDTAKRVGNPNVIWLGWFDEVDHPAETLNIKVN
jgi:hypothetical protein